MNINCFNAISIELLALTIFPPTFSMIAQLWTPGTRQIITVTNKKEGAFYI